MRGSESGAAPFPGVERVMSARPRRWLPSQPSRSRRPPASRRQLSALELVAISTSLPEFVPDMAVLVLFDAAYTPGPLLAAVDPAQSVAAQS